MNTLELTSIMKKCTKKGTHFMGILASNQLPTHKIDKLPALAIINTDPSNKPGQHWLAIYVNANRRGFFFGFLMNLPALNQLNLPFINLFTLPLPNKAQTPEAERSKLHTPRPRLRSVVPGSAVRRSRRKQARPGPLIRP